VDLRWDQSLDVTVETSTLLSRIDVRVHRDILSLENVKCPVQRTIKALTVQKEISKEGFIALEKACSARFVLAAKETRDR
jgi:hypothetical protein